MDAPFSVSVQISAMGAVLTGLIVLLRKAAGQRLLLFFFCLGAQHGGEQQKICVFYS